MDWPTFSNGWLTLIQIVAIKAILHIINKTQGSNAQIFSGSEMNLHNSKNVYIFDTRDNMEICVAGSGQWRDEWWKDTMMW